MRRGLGVAAAVLAAVLGLGALPASAATLTGAPATPATQQPAAARIATEPAGRMTPMASGALSDLGTEAVGDIRRCLSTSGVLNVLYLIDDSGSLRGEGKDKGTDPEVKRAEILASSLDQLGSLGEGLKVNWSSAFFSDGFEEATPWAPLVDGSGDALASKIRQQNDRKGFGWTNWLAGLQGAQQSLSTQQEADPGCAVLVWLTDGLIEFRNDPAKTQRDAAINELCGAQLIDSAPAPAAGNGTFNALREAGVVVLGVLLKVGDPKPSPIDGLMVPLVEGSGPFKGGTATCPVFPIPSTSAHGAVLEATSPGDLARVFLDLGAQLAGGWPSPDQPRADGGFDIDPGVSRFRITLSGTKWKLIAPDGSTLDGAAEGVTVTPSSESVAITVNSSKAARQGEWHIEPMDAAPALFLFSDLSIAFPSDNQLNAGEAGVVHGVVQGPGGAKVDASDFKSLLPRVVVIPADGNAAAQQPLTVTMKDDGTFEVAVPAGNNDSVVRLRAAIDPLATSLHALALAPISADAEIHTTMPGHFASVALSSFSKLEGENGSTQGTMTITGPVDAPEASVCVADPTIVNDAGQRGDWTWTFDGAAKPECYTVAKGETREVAIVGSNPVAAESQVRAELPLEFRAGEDVLSQTYPFTFASTRPVNAAAIGLIALVLLVLGVLLPLVILWFVNWLTTTLSIARNTQRGVLPVTIDGAGVHPSGANSSGALDEAYLGGNVFQNRPPIERERSVHDPDLGEIRARVPWWPVNDTWFEVVPPAGTAIVVARTSSRPGALGSRAQVGDRAVRFAHLPFDSFTAIIVSESELLRTRSGDAVAARAVLYHRPEPGVPDQYTRRIGELRAESDLLKKVDRLREALQREGAGDNVGRAGKAPAASGAASSSARAAQGSGTATPPPPPPPPGRAGAPTSSPSAPPSTSRTSGAPPAPRSAPRTQDGGTPPPPRGSTPPPPPPRGR